MPEIDLIAVGRTIWKSRGVFFSTIAAFVLFMVVILHVVSTKYTVSVSVAPVLEGNSQLNGGLGALARLSGVNLPNSAGGQGQFQLFVSALTSRDTADSLARDAHLMHGLFASQWSASENRWRQPFGLLHAVSQTVKGFLGIRVEPWHPPSGEQVYDMLQGSLEIDDDPKNPTVTLSIQSDRPDVTRELMTKLTTVVDGTLRQRALNRANDYVAYLDKEIDKVTVADYRATLLAHLAEQEQIRMMASANVSFAAQVFSGPSRSSMPTAPKSVLLLFFSLILGALVGGILVIAMAHRGWQTPEFSRLRAKVLARPVN